MMSDHAPSVQERTYPQGTRTSWYDETGIAALTPLGTLSPSAIAEAKQALNDLLNQAPDPHNAYIVFHFQNLASVSPRLRQSAQEVVASLRPDQTLHAALVMRDSLVTSMISALATMLYRQKKKRFNYRTFKDEAAALAWLQMEQSKHSTSAG